MEKREAHQNSKGTSEQARVVRHQAPASPVSAGLPKSSQGLKGTCSEVPKVAWHIGMGAGKRRRLAGDQMERLMEECKASVRAKVEHLFFYVKQMFGYSKTCYRGLPKNENRLPLLLGFANLLRGESCMA